MSGGEPGFLVCRAFDRAWPVQSGCGFAGLLASPRPPGTWGWGRGERWCFEAELLLLWLFSSFLFFRNVMTDFEGN